MENIKFLFINYLIGIILISGYLLCDSENGTQNHDAKMVEKNFTHIMQKTNNQFKQAINDPKVKKLVVDYCKALQDFYMKNNRYQTIERKLMSGATLNGANMVSYLRENVINDADRRFVFASHMKRDVSEKKMYEQKKVLAFDYLLREYPQAECQKTIKTTLKEYMQSYDARKEADQVQWNLGKQFDNYSSWLRLNLEQECALNGVIINTPLLQSLSR